MTDINKQKTCINAVIQPQLTTQKLAQTSTET